MMKLTELFSADFYAVVKEILVIKYGTKEIERRATKVKFVNHMADFSLKTGTTWI